MPRKAMSTPPPLKKSNCSVDLTIALG